MKRQLKKSVVYGLYAVAFGLLVGGVALLGASLRESSKAKIEDEYVSKGILDFNEEVKVVNTDPILVRPYVDDNIVIVKNFYDYQAEAEQQEKSLIYYEDTYIQSSGVSYSSGEAFDVVAVLSGTVKEVREDTTLGNVITIEHDNGITSVYESVSDITVKEGDQVVGGQILAKSSTSNISKELDNHLYFELILNGVCVNPENYFNKSINELGA
ncbi:MAG: M23 family metallopeptidase [bacterium]|nr:M23 family metallopeptidase [bacterium]